MRLLYVQVSFMSMIFTSLCWFSDPVYSFRLQLFFPTCFEDHWIVFVVDIKDRKYVMLDSKHNEDDSFQEAARSRMVSVCVKLPFYEHCLLYIELFFFHFCFCIQRSSFEYFWQKFVHIDMGFPYYEFANPTVPRHPAQNQ
jgi:hypothetical protein